MRIKIKIVVKYSENSWSYEGISDDKVLFKNTLDECTQGIAEFIGAVHGLMHIKKHSLNGDVLVNNSYIRDCLINKDYKHIPKGIKSKDLLKRASMWLLEKKSSIDVELIENKTKETKTENTEISDVSDKFSKRKTWFND